jgi:hypothetical protein
VLLVNDDNLYGLTFALSFTSRFCPYPSLNHMLASRMEEDKVVNMVLLKE